MINYYPYKSDKPNKKYHIITNEKKKFILVLLVILILQFIVVIGRGLTLVKFCFAFGFKNLSPAYVHNHLKGYWSRLNV